MPGMPIYQDSPANLKNQIFAASGSSVINVQADSTGRLKVATDAASPLAVGVDEAVNSITVYGSDGAANQVIKTNATGQLDIRPLTVSDTVNVNITQADDSITVYGNDGTTNQIIRTNATGQLDIRPLTVSDTVSVNITQADDSITVYGSDGTDNHILLTDTAGILQVNSTRAFTNATLTTSDTTDSYQYTTQQEIAQLSSYQFFVKNTGDTNNVTVVVELSPNGTDWVIDSDERQVNPGAATIITSSKFLRYIRLGYKSTSSGASTAISAIFQGQG